MSLYSAQHINEDLLNQTEQVDSLLAEINLLASVANPQDLEELNRNGAKLTENLQSVQELLLEKVHSTEDHFIHQLSGKKSSRYQNEFTATPVLSFNL